MKKLVRAIIAMLVKEKNTGIQASTKGKLPVFVKELKPNPSLGAMSLGKTSSDEF